jgi:hypothetical protein
MSINDIIATSSVHAFNSGVESGRSLEQERIINLAEQRICFDHANDCEHGACYALCELVELIKGKDND